MNRTPSIKALREVFGENAKEAKAVLQMTREQLKQTEGGAARCAECYHPPFTSDIRMHELDRLARTFGVESCETERGEYADYLNAGETYAATVIRWRGAYRVQDVGTFIETQERNGVKFK